MLELEQELELKQEPELERVQEVGLGQYLREELGQELQVLEQIQQLLHLHSLMSSQQQLISVGMKLHSPTCARLPQTPLQ